jgi:hypothetical protein
MFTWDIIGVVGSTDMLATHSVSVKKILVLTSCGELSLNEYCSDRSYFGAML